VRVEPGSYQPLQDEEFVALSRPSVAAVPVEPVFMDLPLLRGQEVAHAPHIAVAATPWPGTVAVWHSDQDDGYSLNHLVEAGATLGTTLNDLLAAAPGRWEEGAALQVQITGGSLSSASRLQVLNGANMAAIGDGSPQHWEVFQFTAAELVGPSIYALRGRLRGQSGSDGTMPALWPAGSLFVLLETQLGQIELAQEARGLERWYRTGVAARGYDDPQVDRRSLAFDGIGLRPYPVCHLRATRQSGAIRLSWTRRSRIDGDNWQSTEVPLGEDREAYQLSVSRDGAVLRSLEVTSPYWSYDAEMQSADAASGLLSFSVAQLSDRFGPGPERVLSLQL
jgi:hypothetical protein